MLYLHNVFNGIWMMESNYATNYLPIIASYIQGNKQPISKDPTTQHKISFAIKQDDHYAIVNNISDSLDDISEKSIALLTIRGAITKQNQFCGPLGMIEQAQILERCYDNENIKGIIINVESGGGEAYAMRTLNEAISKRNKPVIAFIEDFAASAAYGIISGCDHIVANSKLARVGSIGTYQSIADHTEYFKNKGINIIDIYATGSKDKNSDFREALNGNVEPLRKTVDMFNEAFLTQIETNRNRKLTASRSIWGTGKVFFAEEAKSLGLIDDIDSFENVLNYL